jgi:hypothetical protein
VAFVDIYVVERENRKSPFGRDIVVLPSCLSAPVPVHQLYDTVSPLIKLANNRVYIYVQMGMLCKRGGVVREGGKMLGVSEVLSGWRMFGG